MTYSQGSPHITLRAITLMFSEDMETFMGLNSYNVSMNLPWNVKGNLITENYKIYKLFIVVDSVYGINSKTYPSRLSPGRIV